MEDSIGIIVRNYNSKILIIEGDFFIRSKINNNEDIKAIIKKELKENFDIDTFKIKKKFEEKLIYMEERLTMYLVEVGIYNDEFEFIGTDKIIDEIINFKAKDYFKENILKYEEYSILISSIFNVMMAMFLIDIIPKLNVITSVDEILILVIGQMCMYFLFMKYIHEKLTNYIIKFYINTKLANTITTIIMVVYCIRVVINIR